MMILPHRPDQKLTLKSPSEDLYFSALSWGSAFILDKFQIGLLNRSLLSGVSSFSPPLSCSALPPQWTGL